MRNICLISLLILFAACNKEKTAYAAFEYNKNDLYGTWEVTEKTIKGKTDNPPKLETTITFRNEIDGCDLVGHIGALYDIKYDENGNEILKPHRYANYGLQFIPTAKQVLVVNPYNTDIVYYNINIISLDANNLKANIPFYDNVYITAIKRR